MAEHLESFVDAGVERFVVWFTTADQCEQLRRFRDVVESLSIDLCRLQDVGYLVK